MKPWTKALALTVVCGAVASVAPQAEAGARIVVGIGLPAVPWVVPAPVLLAPYPAHGLYGYPRYVRPYGFAAYGPRAFYAAPSVPIGAHRRWHGW